MSNNAVDEDVNLTIYKYSSFAETFTFSYATTSYTYYAQIRDSSNTLIATFSITNSTPNVTISLTRTVIDALNTGTYSWSLKEVHTAVSDERIICKGKVFLEIQDTQTPATS